MVNSLTQFLQSNIENLKENGLYNEIDILDSANGANIVINGKSYINLSSNNYLGLATNPRLINTVKKYVDIYGVGAGAVRPINGTLKIHTDLEKRISEFKGSESTVVYQSGFNCNMATISALMTKDDLIISDELNHASIIDGCRLSNAKVVRIKHSNMQDFKEKAMAARESNAYKKIMFITDGVFSMDGDICPLDEIVKIAKEFDVITYVDDAHGSGVTGKGAGTVKQFGLQNEVDIQVGTLSKAIGVVGGYVSGKKIIIDWLKVNSRPFLFSTALMPIAAAACIEAINIISDTPELHNKLWENGNYLKENLKKLGYNIGASQTPITPCIIGNEALTQTFSKELMKEGIYAKSIVFPTVPLGTGRIRNMPIATHSKDMLDTVIEKYKVIGKNLGVI